VNPAEFANIARAERDMWWFRGMNLILERVLERYNTPDIREVLEAGCGTGYLSSLIERDFGWCVTAIDLSAQGLAYARGYGVRRTAQADIRELPFRPAHFDAVICMDVIVHFRRGEEGAALREMVRVLKPRGLFVIRVSALDILRSRHSQFAHERQRFTRKRLIRAVSDAGIEVLRCTYLNSLLLPVSFTKFRIWEPLTGQPPSSGVKLMHPALEAILRKPLEMEAAWIGAGLNFPAGQSLLLAGTRR
jgi:SAM-dependent methyltransferase